MNQPIILASIRRWPVGQTLGLSLLGLVLVSAALLEFVPARVALDAVRLRPLVELLPREVAGWEVTDMPLGKTEGEEQAVRDVLKYDDAILRNYTRGDITIGMHVVYWRPESGAPGDVRSHSPDFCFPAAGWQCVATGYERVVQAGHWISAPAQYRIFEANGQRLELLFWHLRAGELSGNFMGEQSRWKARFPYMLRHFWRSFPGGAYTDEIFVRITVNGSIASVADDELFVQLAGTLSLTGAFRRGVEAEHG